MSAKRFALFGGIAMLLIGAMAFIPSLFQVTDGLPALKDAGSYGLFLGVFPMNIYSKVGLILLGCVGIYAANQRSTDLPSSINFSRLIFGLMTLAVILGAIPETSTLFGYVPLFGYTIAFNAFFAIIGAYSGFALTSEVPKIEAQNDARQPTRGAAMNPRTNTTTTKPATQH